MADSVSKGFDVEQLFALFYNGGNRRTLVAVAQAAAENGVDVSNMTLRRYANEFDWPGRADAMDAQARALADKRVASMVARHRVRQVETIATLQTKFMRRLIPSTVDNPNPAEIRPEDLEVCDFIALSKAFELLTGGATQRVGLEGSSSALDEMTSMIAEMDRRELLELPAADGGG